jgi:formylglycine-generating enzyme required for sulfatase activity
MPTLRLFLSYRREDLHGHAPAVVGRIHDRLVQHYGTGNVFMDIDAIPPGADFVDYLGSWVGKADVLLAVIGPQWAEILESRSDRDDDFVRIEIEAALERRIPVVPLFLAGGAMPGPEVLGGNLAPLRRRNGFPVDSGRDFNPHLTRLIAELDKHYSVVPEEVPLPSQPPPLPEVTDALGMKFIPIEPGKFRMGSPQGEDGRYDDETLHEVTLTRGFEIADAPVTQAQWERIMGNNPSYFIASGSEAPVEQVSWEDAVAWCGKMTDAHPGWHYFLPTEAQWEWACRAGTVGPWNVAGATLDQLGWYERNSGGKTHPVRQKRPNAWGLYDCHGNVWEWCADWFGPYAKGALTDPTGPSDGENRVLRGGAWFNEARICRSAYRLRRRPGHRSIVIGFRPVRMKKA